MLKRFFGLLALCLAALTACAPAAPPTPTATTAPTAAPETTAAVTESVSGEAWLALPLRDARTGETFTVADFAGRTVYVHPMARW